MTKVLPHNPKSTCGCNKCPWQTSSGPPADNPPTIPQSLINSRERGAQWKRTKGIYWRLLILEVYRNARFSFSEHHVSCAFLLVTLLHSAMVLWWFASNTFTIKKCTIFNNNNNRNRIGFQLTWDLLDECKLTLFSCFFSIYCCYLLTIICFETLTFFFQRTQKGNFLRTVMLFIFIYLLQRTFLCTMWILSNWKKQHEHSTKHLFLYSSDTGMCRFEMVTQSMTKFVYVLFLSYSFKLPLTFVLH